MPWAKLSSKQASKQKSLAGGASPINWSALEKQKVESRRATK
jgi:hypothetical protein